MLAISYGDYDRYGCPNCGCDFAVAGPISGGGVGTGTCEECRLSFVILADGIEKSRMGFGTGRKDPDGKDVVEYPSRIEHPRRGIPKHAYAWPDPRPESGGEYWSSRGIGYDLSGFVKSKAAGERLLSMVRRVLRTERPESWLDWRPSEPKWIQFKFQKSEFDLERLQDMAEKAGGIVTEDILAACRAG